MSSPGAGVSTAAAVLDTIHSLIDCRPMPLVGPALYRNILRPLLFALDAETAHDLALAFLSALPSPSPRADPPELRTSLRGVDFSNPIGLAAGMDKDARAVGAWGGI